MKLILVRRNSNRITASTKKRRSDDSEIFKRKYCEQVMRVKKDLKDLNPNNLDFPEGTRLFINDIMCPYYKVGTNIKN